MLGVLSTNPPDSVSTAVIGSVLECHDQGFHFLGGMVPDVNKGRFYDHVDLAVPVVFALGDTEYEVWKADSVRYHATVVPGISATGGDLEPATLAANAVRHFRELMGRGRDERMRYLTDAGMRAAEVASLLALVVRWLDEAGLENLGVLSRIAVEGDLGPGHVLERWINGRSKLDLALLLDDTPIGDRELAVAYALAHASALVLASYWSDAVPDDGVLALVPGDDLD